MANPMRLEPLSQTIIKCAQMGIALKVTRPDGVIIEPDLTRVDFTRQFDDDDKITSLAKQFQGRARGTGRA